MYIYMQYKKSLFLYFRHTNADTEILFFIQMDFSIQQQQWDTIYGGEGGRFCIDDELNLLVAQFVMMEMMRDWLGFWGIDDEICQCLEFKLAYCSHFVNFWVKSCGIVWLWLIIWSKTQYSITIDISDSKTFIKYCKV